MQSMPDQDRQAPAAPPTMPTIRVPIDALMALISAAETAASHYEQLGGVSVTLDRWARAVATANSAIRAQVRP